MLNRVISRQDRSIFASLGTASIQTIILIRRFFAPVENKFFSYLIFNKAINLFHRVYDKIILYISYYKN